MVEDHFSNVLLTIDLHGTKNVVPSQTEPGTPAVAWPYWRMAINHCEGSAWSRLWPATQSQSQLEWGIGFSPPKLFFVGHLFYCLIIQYKDLYFKVEVGLH